MIADVVRRRMSLPAEELSKPDQELLTSVVHLAELVGKPVTPVVVPTDDPFDALTRVARAIDARELVVAGLAPPVDRPTLQAGVAPLAGGRRGKPSPDRSPSASWATVKTSAGTLG